MNESPSLKRLKDYDNFIKWSTLTTSTSQEREGRERLKIDRKEKKVKHRMKIYPPIFLLLKVFFLAMEQLVQTVLPTKQVFCLQLMKHILKKQHFQKQQMKQQMNAKLKIMVSITCWKKIVQSRKTSTLTHTASFNQMPQR